MPRPFQVRRDLRRVGAGEAGVAEVGGIAVPGRGTQHAVEREVAEAVYAQMFAYLLDAVARRNQLLFAGRVDPVIARAGDGWRGDAEMHFLRSRLADQLDEGA